MPLMQLLACVLGLTSAFGAIIRDEAFAKQENLGPRVDLDSKSKRVQEAAEWVLAELRPLSDSGIYSTLHLSRIIEASEQEGVYHHNTFLTLELKSPHLAGGVSNSVHDIIVMEDLEDHVRSFAIDEFPVMEASAVEEFWQKRVDREIAERDSLLDELEKEAEEMQKEWMEKELDSD